MKSRKKKGVSPFSKNRKPFLQRLPISQKHLLSRANTRTKVRDAKDKKKGSRWLKRSLGGGGPNITDTYTPSFILVKNPHGDVARSKVERRGGGEELSKKRPTSHKTLVGLPS